MGSADGDRDRLAVWVRLLGPVDVAAGGPPGEPRPVSGPRRRALLAALALSEGSAVSSGQLIEIIWSGAAPPRAATTLLSHVSYLRGVLGRKTAVVACRPGYMLDLGADATDVRIAQRLLDEGTQAADPRAGVAALRSALALWRGRPLAGVPGGLWLDDQVRQLDLLHDEVQRALAGALLAAGDPPGAVPVLEQLVAAHPLDEQAHGQLMLALYRSGQQSDALAVYRRLRQALREELGIDPGPAVRDLETAILQQDPALAAAVTVAPGPAGVPGPVAPPAPARITAQVPAQLPPAVRGFAGRRAELARLDAVAAGPGGDAPGEDAPGGVAIAVVSGGAGVGKTTLAVHWAHRVRDQFPGGQLYVNLRGFDPSGQPLDPAQAMREFLEALGVPEARIPASLPAQAALYRTLLASRRVLVVLDNARVAAQVRPLLPGSPGCLVLVTSRDPLAGLVATEAGIPLTLDVLPGNEARDLLAQRLGAGRIAAEPGAADDIIAACARLPLALSIAASQALTRPGLSLTALAAELHGARPALDPFGSGDPAADVRTVFSWSYRSLSDDAARLFRLLGLHPGPDFSLAAVASLAAISPQLARTLLAELTQASLLTQHAAGRWAFHDLLRAYAADQASACDSPAERDAALRRVLDCYLQGAHRAAVLIKPERSPIDLAAPLPGTVTESVSTLDEAGGWFGAEHPVLMACIREAAAAGHSRAAWQLVWSTKIYWFRRGHWPEMVAAGAIACAAARDDGEPAWQAEALFGVSWACMQLDREDEAEQHLWAAYEIYLATGDLSGQASVRLALVHAAEHQHRLADALEYSLDALRLYREAGDRAGQARALNGVGWFQVELGEFAAAVAPCREGLALAQELGEHDAEAETWHTLGTAYLGLADHQQAQTCLQRSREIAVERSLPASEAAALASLGDVHLGRGDHAAARQAWTAALRIFDDIRHPDAGKVRARLGLSPASAGRRRPGRRRAPRFSLERSCPGRNVDVPL